MVESPSRKRAREREGDEDEDDVGSWVRVWGMWKGGGKEGEEGMYP